MKQRATASETKKRRTDATRANTTNPVQSYERTQLFGTSIFLFEKIGYVDRGAFADAHARCANVPLTMPPNRRRYDGKWHIGKAKTHVGPARIAASLQCMFLLRTTRPTRCTPDNSSAVAAHAHTHRVCFVFSLTRLPVPSLRLGYNSFCSCPSYFTQFHVACERAHMLVCVYSISCVQCGLQTKRIRPDDKYERAENGGNARFVC